MGCSVDDVLALVHQLEQVTGHEGGRLTRLAVAGATFGYVWPATRTVGLKQLLPEQMALIAERPEVFESQHVSGRFGWVVVHLDRVERDELAELVFEAWRLTAPQELVAARADRLPT